MGSSHPYGVPVPQGLYEAIEAERSNLAKAESLLGCLTIALEYGDADSPESPYYPDVAQAARELVRKSINGLDSLTLHQRLARDRVKEETALPMIGEHSSEPIVSILWERPRCVPLPLPPEAR
jgi:hypothetical protein